MTLTTCSSLSLSFPTCGVVVSALRSPEKQKGRRSQANPTTRQSTRNPPRVSSSSSSPRGCCSADSAAEEEGGGGSGSDNQGISCTRMNSLPRLK
uniref:Uncharacterized protein n=1 Tax=Oryza rufipogon TaxID=4529 RepID=A0A0E0NAK5_ORYRU